MKLVQGEAKRAAFELEQLMISKGIDKDDDLREALDKLSKARNQNQLETLSIKVEQLVFDKTGKWLY